MRVTDLYDLLHQISHILTPETDSFYDFVLHTSDDNGGFLRTRWCYWEEKVHNLPLNTEIHTVLVIFQDTFSENYYKDKETLVKLQLFYSEFSKDNIEWSRQGGYVYA